MVWVRLDDQFHSNPKVLAMGLEGAGLYARALSYCGDYMTDGFVPFQWLWSAADQGKDGEPQGLLDLLIAVGAIVYVEGPPEGFTIKDFLMFNPSKANVMEERRRKSEGGRKGANKRWSSSSHKSSKGEPIVDPLGDPMGDGIGGSNAPEPEPTTPSSGFGSSNRSKTTETPSTSRSASPAQVEFRESVEPCCLCERVKGIAGYHAGQWWCEECFESYWQREDAALEVQG